MESKLLKAIGSKKNIDLSICVLRILAMVLIINSHSDDLFPSKISFLASGGAIGNELFFLISGYLFSNKTRFDIFFIRRLIRLYFPMALVTTVLFAIKYYPIRDLMSVSGFIYNYIWPTNYWFVSSIFVFGIILYFLSKTKLFSSSKRFIAFVLFLLILNLLVYCLFVKEKDVWCVEDYRLPGIIPFKSIYSFLVFTIGYYLKSFDFKKVKKVTSKMSLVVATVSLILFYAFKLLLNKGYVPMELQILSQVITIICVTSIFLFVKRSISINKLLGHIKNTKIIYYLSCITLESYLIQFVVIDKTALCNLSFPVNYLTSVLTIFLLSFALYLLDTFVNGLITLKSSSVKKTGSENATES